MVDFIGKIGISNLEYKFRRGFEGWEKLMLTTVKNILRQTYNAISFPYGALGVLGCLIQVLPNVHLLFRVAFFFMTSNVD